MHHAVLGDTAILLDLRTDRYVASPAAAAKGVDVLITSLPTSDIGRQVMLAANGVADGAEPGLIVCDTTTARPEDSEALAAALKARGVQPGDVVGIYLPMIPEVIVAMLACARIGAPHNVVFGGFSAESVAERMAVSHAKALITVDGARRKGRTAPVKAEVDAVLAPDATIEVSNVQGSVRITAWDKNEVELVAELESDKDELEFEASTRMVRIEVDRASPPTLSARQTERVARALDGVSHPGRELRAAPARAVSEEGADSARQQRQGVERRALERQSRLVRGRPAAWDRRVPDDQERRDERREQHDLGEHEHAHAEDGVVHETASCEDRPAGHVSAAHAPSRPRHACRVRPAWRS